MTRLHTDKDMLSAMFAFLSLYLKFNGKQGLLDENKVMEDIMCEILNRVYGWKLNNLNTKRQNFPGIDLGDAQIGLGVQVTADKTSAKLQHTLAKVMEHDVYKTYPHIKMMILVEKQASYSVSEMQQYDGQIIFDSTQDVMDLTDVLEASAYMDADARHELVAYLQEELNWNSDQTISRARTYEKLQDYWAEQRAENAYIMVLGVRKKLPIDKAWLRLKIMNEADIREKQTQTQWEFLKQYDEYSGRGNEQTYDVDTLLLEPGNKVVLGGPGMGKSTMCKKLFCQAEKMQKSAAKVRLWDVVGYMRSGCSFEEALRKTMTQSLEFDFDKEEISKYFSVLILDGLDECGDNRRNVARAIASWGVGHPTQILIVTSRPIGYDATALSEFTHYQILPLDDSQLDSFAQQLMEMIQPDYKSNYQWFSDRIKKREIHSLACRSPLILSFMVQLSLKQKEFGTNKICLYQAIIEEWLQGSSRENVRKLSDVELIYGIEAIAYYMLSNVNDTAGDAYTKSRIVTYVGTFFEREMAYARIESRKVAELCLDFWLQRGILDKGIHKGQECFLFLHLNVGEYLAACFLSRQSENERRQWILEHYRDNIWQETLRMAIACEHDSCMVQELLKIEQQHSLPEGAVFFAAQGIGESMEKHVPQALYDQLWKYAFCDNPYLAEKATRAMDDLRGGEIDWHVQQLREYVWTGEQKKRICAYHILFVAFFDDEESVQQLARHYVIEVAKSGDRMNVFDDLTKALNALKPNAEDKELINAIKKLSFDDLTMNELEAVIDFADKNGEKEWAQTKYSEFMTASGNFSVDMFNQQMRQSERRLIEILGELFGMTPCAQIDECREYSKIAAVMRIMDAPITDTKKLGLDLLRAHSRELIRTVCEVVEIDQEQIKKEVYSLLHYVNQNRSFLSSGHLLHLHMKGDWAKSAGKIGCEALEEGLCSRSDILGECAVYMAFYNYEVENVRSLLVQMFRTNPTNYTVDRVGRVLSAYKEKTLELYAMERITEESVPTVSCLYRYMPEKIGDVDQKLWLSCIQQGVDSNRYMIQATLKYILSVDMDGIPQSTRSALKDLVKRAYQDWGQKKIRCSYCDDGTIVDESGFCPKCHFGAKLPTTYFVEVLSKYCQLTMEDYISLNSHSMSEVRDIARRELKKIWIEDSTHLEKVIHNFKNYAYDASLYELILQLPSDVTYPFRNELQRLGMEGDEERLIVWIGKLRLLDWISAESRKEILTKCLSHNSDRVRYEAMECWLDQKSAFSWMWQKYLLAGV